MSIYQLDDDFKKELEDLLKQMEAIVEPGVLETKDPKLCEDMALALKRARTIRDVSRALDLINLPMDGDKI